jgi:hypothetical protein
MNNGDYAKFWLYPTNLTGAEFVGNNALTEINKYINTYIIIDL